MARLLYLAKRVRPDLLVTVSFLTTRVQCSTEEDLGKLDRCLRYLNSTSSLGIVLDCSKGLGVSAWIDASYAVHFDMRSHTGAIVSLGKGPIAVLSSKQKINTKSSTEAELVGLSDATSAVIWQRDFLIEQGYCVDAAIVYQDNLSTIALAERGAAASQRSKHIATRYFWVKDRISVGEIKLEYLPTSQMLADVLTKPLQGELFRKLRDELLNWYVVI